MVKTGKVLPSRRFGLVRRFSAEGVFVLASVKVANTGTEPLSSLRLNLVIDGESLQGPVAASRAAAAAASSPDPLNYLALEAPMGGWKSSGLGTRHGADGIRKYTRKQVSVITRLGPKREIFMYPYGKWSSKFLGMLLKLLNGRGEAR